MSELPLTLFDVGVLVVVGLSALLALTRGAVAEILGLASWVGAGALAFVARPHVLPLVRPVVASDTVADVLAVAGTFLVALVAFKLVSSMIVRVVESTALGPFDKLLGLVFGALRGAVLVCAAYLVVSQLIPPETQPDWVRQAYLIGPVRDGSVMLERLVPAAYRQEGLAAADAAVGAAGRAIGDAAAQGSGGHGYTAEQRQALDRLLAPQR